MKKGLIALGVIGVIALGVGGYILYKRSKPSRKMFDEMVSNCKAPCDVFSGLTQSQLDKLYKGFQKLKKEDAQFMIDFMGNSIADMTDEKRFNTLFSQMRKGLIK